MNIVMLTEYFFPFDRGGTEWSVYYLARELITAGHEVTLLTPNYGAAYEEELEKIKIRRIPFIKHLKTTNGVVRPIYFINPLWWIISFFYILKYAIITKPDILHIHSKYFLPATILTGKLLHIPTVTTLRDYIILCPLAFCIEVQNKYKACSLAQLYSRDQQRFSAEYFYPNSFSSRYLFKVVLFYGWIVSKLLKRLLFLSDKVIGISYKLADIYKLNGVRVDQVIYNPMKIEQSVGIKRKNKILFVGRLTPGKGIKQLVAAYHQLQKRNKNLPKLEIIGDGLLKRELISMNFKTISFHDHIPYLKVLQQIKESRFLIMPSVWEEPFGRSALEALSFATPVLASNKGALPEIVVNNKYGIICDPTVEQLEKGLKQMLIQESELREGIIKNRKVLMNKFELSPIQQYRDVYASLL